MRSLSESRIGVVGLGYVGLPLAVEFAECFNTIGLDINQQRIRELMDGIDKSMEVDSTRLKRAKGLEFTSNPHDLRDCNVYIITVPTPIDRNKRPDLRALVRASTTIGKLLAKGDIVIYESTVYPGATEEVCVPILEAESGMTFNRDFFAGYSPERINPGDKEHGITTIKKVTSGSTPEVADFIDRLYSTVVKAGTHRASSIKVAEAAKVIENTQRDVNIALINELAMLFNTLGLNTLEILEAAGSKWNFLPFRPGLVGGHCIGVDPYYLTHKAQEVGHHPEIILAGRRINDQMGAYVVERVVKLMTRNRVHVARANVLLMGLTFKENCPDVRNSRAFDIIRELEGYNALVEVYDPWVDPEEVAKEMRINLIDRPEKGRYDAIILAVSHRQFRQMGAAEIRALGKPQCILFDVKYVLPKEEVDAAL
ncbi:MAG: Vi polysaccharide biosynthesis UDP-N-acetylglucosamine C-6 dehydrogenase TviB [Gammaproteobacteria bacterium]